MLENLEVFYFVIIFLEDIIVFWLFEGFLIVDMVLIIGEGGLYNVLDFEWGGEMVWFGLFDYKSYYRVYIL